MNGPEKPMSSCVESEISQHLACFFSSLLSVWGQSWGFACRVPQAERGKGVRSDSNDGSKLVREASEAGRGKEKEVSCTDCPF